MQQKGYTHPKKTKANVLENVMIEQHSKCVGVSSQQQNFVEVFQHNSTDGLLH